jgi:glutamyl-tRNA synthetase
VTHVVRGEDLLASAPRQVLIYKALGWERAIPAYTHLPLVVGPDGRKLAKRHGDTRLCQLREEGVSAGQVRHMLAVWSGWTPRSEDTPIAEWIDRFDLARLPPSPMVYDDAHARPHAAAVRGAS